MGSADQDVDTVTGRPAHPSKYETVGPEFARWRRQHYRAAHYADLFAAAPSPCRLAVDAGCGAGDATATLAERARRVIGLDTSWTQLRLAQAHLASCGVGNVWLVRGDMCRPPLRPGGTDFVLAVLSLHQTDRAESLPALTELLAPAGTLAARSWIAPLGWVSRLLPVRFVVSLRRVVAAVRRDGLRKGLGATSFLLGPAWLLNDSRPKPGLATFRRECARLLPGCVLRRCDRATVTLLWQRPG